MLIIHGDADDIVPHCQSIFLNRALTKKGVKNELVIVPKGGHGGGINMAR
jgi:dipeptidyl aminopeptidase/acylaminoacyl peptidase